jgi:hypothetical protein
MIAKEATDDPKMEHCWLIRKNVMLRFHVSG